MGVRAIFVTRISGILFTGRITVILLGSRELLSLQTSTGKLLIPQLQNPNSA